MKFGNFLEENKFVPYSNYYVNYGELKSSIYSLRESMKDSTTGQVPASNISSLEARFQDLIYQELWKVNGFAMVQCKAFQDSSRRVSKQVCKCSLSKGIFDSVNEELDNLRTSVLAFGRFIWLNKQAIRKICKKFDKVNRSHSLKWFMQIVDTSFFMTDDVWEGPVLSLAGVEAEMRDHNLPSQRIPSMNSAAFFTLATSKRSTFWVSAEDTMKVVSLLSRNMILVDEANNQSLMVRQFYELYYDDKSNTAYKKVRSNKPDSSASGVARVFSLSWCGSSFNPKSDIDSCTVNREVHYKIGTSSTSSGNVAWSVSITQKSMYQLLSGKTTTRGYLASYGFSLSSSEHELLTEFIQYASESDIRPSILVSFRRMRFLDETTGTGAILDRNVTYADILATASKTAFFAQPLEVFSKSVLTVVNVQGFSKFVHGEALLHLNDTSELLPSWYGTATAFDSVASFERAPSEAELGSSVAASDPLHVSARTNLHLLGRDYSYASGNGAIVPSVSVSGNASMMHQRLLPERFKEHEPFLPPPPAASLPGDLTAPLLARQRQSGNRTSLVSQLVLLLLGSTIHQKYFEQDNIIAAKIEPKTVLANERTYLDWVYISFLMSTYAISLEVLHPNARFVSVLASLTSFCIIIWSIFAYVARNKSLKLLKDLDCYSNSGKSGMAVCVSMIFCFGLLIVVK